MNYRKFAASNWRLLTQFTATSPKGTAADHISEDQFEELDSLAWKLDNGLKKLVESLQEKAGKEWSDTFIVKESNELYRTEADSEIYLSNNPTIQ